MAKIPQSLERDPIVEAIFEIRFSSRTEFVANILPGLFYPHVRDQFPKLESLPTANIPAQFQVLEPSLKYRPHNRMSSNNYMVLTGEHVLSVSCRRPYTGWKDFSAVIHKFVDILHKTELADIIERFSLKYVNLLDEETDSKEQFRMTELSVQLGSYTLTDHLTYVRTEINKDGFVNVVQIISGASVQIEGAAPVNGLLVDIDTIFNGPFTDFWTELPDLLERAHATEKSIFFENVLTRETIDKRGPVWG